MVLKQIKGGLCKKFDKDRSLGDYATTKHNLHNLGP